MPFTALVGSVWLTKASKAPSKLSIPLLLTKSVVKLAPPNRIGKASDRRRGVVAEGKARAVICR